MNQNETDKIRLVIIADTHLGHHDILLPDGDILIVAGDFTEHRQAEIVDFNNWLGMRPHSHKIIIAGNHDLPVENNPDEARELLFNAIYLQDKCANVMGLSFYGTPWSPASGWSFQLEDDRLNEKWRKIPENIDVLVTHCPPYGILDRSTTGIHLGCPLLTENLQRIRPKLHVFGHIHESYGILRKDGTLYANASICNIKGQEDNRPIVIDWRKNRTIETPKFTELERT
ncbi:MAG TPA: metallophosphoesterase [Lentisphaeria bacterium]|nr:MAG: hypothetical protein A2X48_15165 [Lentisphaerae bacterium GWF2_49_21]HBC89320.1 metallophosphoesterase [Lentisphaeria bacterium]